jgi:pimeloyl-ACP methyl ester carboxylesterase
MDAFVADLAGLLARLEVGRAAFVGATLGGVAVLEFALAHPEAASAVVLVSTAPDATEEMRARFEASAAVVESGDLAAFAEGFVSFIFSPDYVAAHADEVADFRQRLERIDPAGYAGSIRALGNRPDLTPRLGRLRVPALVVTGALDPIPTSAPGAELLARTMPDARAVVVPGAAHLPHIEQPAAFNQFVLEFLSRRSTKA